MFAATALGRVRRIWPLPVFAVVLVAVRADRVRPVTAVLDVTLCMAVYTVIGAQPAGDRVAILVLPR